MPRIAREWTLLDSFLYTIREDTWLYQEGFAEGMANGVRKSLRAELRVKFPDAPPIPELDHITDHTVLLDLVHLAAGSDDTETVRSACRAALLAIPVKSQTERVPA